MLWLLRELQLEHQVLRMPPKAIKQMAPTGKVPILEHKGQMYTESLAIMEYCVHLADKPVFIPATQPDAFTFRHFIYYLQSEVEAYLWVAEQASGLKAIYAWPEGTYSEALQRVETNIQPLFTQISPTGFICTDFTIADIYAYHVFTWAQAQGVTLPNSVLQYLNHLENRPFFPSEMKLIARI